MQANLFVTARASTVEAIPNLEELPVIDVVEPALKVKRKYTRKQKENVEPALKPKRQYIQKKKPCADQNYVGPLEADKFANGADLATKDVASTLSPKW